MFDYLVQLVIAGRGKSVSSRDCIGATMDLAGFIAVPPHHIPIIYTDIPVIVGLILRSKVQIVVACDVVFTVAGILRLKRPC